MELIEKEHKNSDKLANIAADRLQSLPDGLTVALIDDTSANILHDFGYHEISFEEPKDQKDPRVGDALQAFDDLTHDEQLRVIYGDQSSDELREILQDIIESESVDIEDIFQYIEERK